MPYSLETLLNEGCIAVRHWGDVTGHEIQDAHRDVIERLAISGVKKLMIDVRNAHHMPSLAELYFLVGDTARRQRFGVRTAIVTEIEQEATAKFIARVAAHHGTSIDVFDNDDEALSWLAG